MTISAGSLPFEIIRLAELQLENVVQANPSLAAADSIFCDISLFDEIITALSIGHLRYI